MSEQKPCCASCAAKSVKMLTFPDGIQIAISNLDTILKEVADLKLTDTQTIKTELLERVKTCNYVISGAEDEYAEVLFKEYRKNSGSNN